MLSLTLASKNTSPTDTTSEITIASRMDPRLSATIPSEKASPAIRILKSKIPKISDSEEDRKSTRLNSSHVAISYAVFCLKKKKTKKQIERKNQNTQKIC